MASLSDLIPDICPELPQCPVVNIHRQLRYIIRDFCWQTHYWQHPMAPITLLAFNDAAPDTYLYTLAVPEETDLLAVDELVYDARVLPMKSSAWLDENVHRWRQDTGIPQYTLMMSNKQVRFVPASDQVRPVAVTGTLILRPSRSAFDFDDSLMEFDQALSNGALSRLLIMPKKPWSDARRAATCEGIYQDGISRAKFLVIKGFSEGAETIVRRTWL